MGVIDGEKMFAAPVNEVVVGTKTPGAGGCSTPHEEMEKVFRGLTRHSGRRPPGAGPASRPPEKLVCFSVSAPASPTILILPSMILITLLNLYPAGRRAYHRQPAEPEHDPAEPDRRSSGSSTTIRALSRSTTIFWGEPGQYALFYWTARSVRRLYRGAGAGAPAQPGHPGARALPRAFLVPWVIPDVATALLWKWLYADQYGVINFLLAKARTDQQADPVAVEPDMAMASVIIGADLEAHAGHVHRAARGPAERAEGVATRRPRSTAPDAMQRFRYVTFP